MKNKKIFGVCKVGEKGQIVIPKEARDMFEIKPGDSLILLGDKNKGIAIVKTEIFESIADSTLGEINDNKN
ncbi:MAG: AbrB/MazE/SpoVT family DNA-binding domain-containing protein [Clostridia bacterium]|nr:AbrB/MazE/SpoVT family DNA-binding domain-containing protein [Clostridia bacterium]